MKLKRNSWIAVCLIALPIGVLLPALSTTRTNELLIQYLKVASSTVYWQHFRGILE